MSPRSGYNVRVRIYCLSGDLQSFRLVTGVSAVSVPILAVGHPNGLLWFVRSKYSLSWHRNFAECTR